MAELSNCSFEQAILNKPGYYYKNDCDWDPLENKIFTKTIDLSEAINSKAFKEKGDFDGIFSSRRKAALLLIFDDEGITFRTSSWSDSTIK